MVGATPRLNDCMRWLRRVGAVHAVAGLLVLCLAAPASAAPLVMARDRSDNTYYFDYDADSGQILQESSALFVERGDPVSFLLYVREAGESAPAGERLKARFSLSLNKKRVVRYEGTFTLVVKDAAGVVVVREQKVRRIVLRPLVGKRRAAFTIPFDLPISGVNYEAKALFRAS